jgi:hypothetical protein
LTQSPQPDRTLRRISSLLTTFMTTVKNGLYSIRIEMKDGGRGHATGVIVLRDGHILGGDSNFYYSGSYVFNNGKWRGDIVTRQHTQAIWLEPAIRWSRGHVWVHRHLFRRQR